MALRKSTVPVSDVSSHLDGLLFFISALPTLYDSTIQQPPSDGRLLPGCSPRHTVGTPVTPRVLPLCVTASGSAYPDVTNQHSNQVPGSHASWHATIRFASPCLSPHAAPLPPSSFNCYQQSARAIPNLKCLFLTVAAVSTRRRSSAHQGDDEPRDGT